MADAPSRFVRPLSEAERAELERLRGNGPHALATRAAAILLSAARVPIPEIMRRLKVSRPSIAGWLTRFERGGVGLLSPRPRPGRPRKLTPDLMRQVANAVRARPRWTLSTLREHLIGAGHVSTISEESLRVALRNAGLTLKAARTGLVQKGNTTMIPAAFDYHAPASIGEATALLARLGEDAKVLSGGQSLIPMMKLRLATPTHIVDINNIQGLAGVSESGGVLKIGALTRESDLEESEVVRSRYPLLHDTCKVIADPLVRNLATVGGNLAHADPANDHPATMLALGAEVVAAGPKGERKIPIASFFTGPFATALRADEILVAINIPAPPARSGGAYLKLERKVGDFATAAVAVQVALGAGGTCDAVGIGLTNVGLTPIKATEAEASLKGKKADDAAIKRAAELAAAAAQPSDDLRGSAEYKKDLIRVLTARALRKAIERAEGRK